VAREAEAEEVVVVALGVRKAAHIITNSPFLLIVVQARPSKP
jgi:hypothetical protein